MYDPTAMQPTIEFTSVPALGSYRNLNGIARNVDAANVRVAVYIRVDGGWWNKPYWESPATELAPEGSFSVCIATGGRDEHATEIAAFLIPAELYPPAMRGQPELPPDLFEKALAHASVTRAS